MKRLSQGSGAIYRTDQKTSSPRHVSSELEAKLIENQREFLRFLVRRLGNRDTAEEVLQKFYLRVVSTNASLRSSESVMSWLYTILRTTLVDHFRKETARRRRESDYATLQTLANEAWEDERPRKHWRCLYRVLPGLRPDYYDIIHKVDLSERPPRTVARDMGITANNLRVRLHRARRALRDALVERCGTCAEDGCQDCPGDHTAFSIRPHEGQPSHCGL